MGVGFDHRVESHQQLAHAGDEDDLGGFALSGQSVGEGADRGVGPAGREGGHVEHAADVLPASLDRAFAF